MINTIILMAGRGTRFEGLDDSRPKPLILLHGKPLIEWVIKNLTVDEGQLFIFVCLEEHVERFKLNEYFSSLKINFRIARVSSVTEGAACSAILAARFVEPGDVVIANSDQYMYFRFSDFLAHARKRCVDGMLATMTASGDKWSYVKTNESENVIEVKEKKQISNIATTGLYYFKNWDLFESAVTLMIRADDRYNGEFYLAPTYNYLGAGKEISHFHIGDVGREMVGLGTKDDFLTFQADDRSKVEYEKLFK